MELIEVVLYAYFGLLGITGFIVLLRFISSIFGEEKQ